MPFERETTILSALHLLTAISISFVPSGYSLFGHQVVGNECAEPEEQHKDIRFSLCKCSWSTKIAAHGGHSCYRSLPSKCPWVLEIHGQKNGGGRLHREAINMHIAYTHKLSKNGGGGGWALTQDNMVAVMPGT